MPATLSSTRLPVLQNCFSGHRSSPRLRGMGLDIKYRDGGEPAGIKALSCAGEPGGDPTRAFELAFPEE